MGIRLELFVRIILIIVISFVIGFWEIWIAVCWLIQFFFVLITGKRSKWLNKQIRTYYKFLIKFQEYALLLTDRRPI